MTIARISHVLAALTVGGVLIVCLASVGSAATAGEHADRIGDQVNQQAVRSLGGRFSCAVAPRAKRSATVIVFVASRGDLAIGRRLLSAIAAQQHVAAPSHFGHVRVGQHRRRRNVLLTIRSRIDRRISTLGAGLGAYLPDAHGKSLCPRVQIAVGNHPTARVSRAAQRLAQHYGTSRVRVAHTSLGTPATRSSVQR